MIALDLIAEITTATPAQIDGELYELLLIQARAEGDVVRAWGRVHRSVRDTQEMAGTGRNRRPVWKLTDEQALQVARTNTDPYSDCAEAVSNLKSACTALAEVAERINRLEDEFTDRGGWTRAWVVTSSDNCHVHSSRNCGTCYITTTYALLAPLSGKTRAEIIDAAGADACTVCYKGAPLSDAKRTAYTPAEKKTQEERDAIAAEKARKAAEKAAKAITNADGTPLLDDDNRPVKTEVAARNTALRCAADILWYGTTHPFHEKWAGAVTRAVAALAAKTGRAVDDVQAEIDRKAAAKHARESA
jgi:hypothetical protein